MKKLALISAFALAMTATPVLAQTVDNFTGPRVAGTVATSFDDGNDGVRLGGSVGLDEKVNDRLLLGITAEATDSTSDNTGREFSLTGRLGTPVTNNVLVFGTAGYTNARFGSVDLDGLRAGAGVEVAFNRNVFATAEYQYRNFERGFDSNGAALGIGFRF